MLYIEIRIKSTKIKTQVATTNVDPLDWTHLGRLGEVIGNAQAYGEEEADLKEDSAWW